MKLHHKIVLALISCWALFFGVFGWVASGLSGFSFALTNGDGCFACFNPETLYTPILSWAFITALGIGFSGGLYYLRILLNGIRL
jgi:hypothetical protein